MALLVRRHEMPASRILACSYRSFSDIRVRVPYSEEPFGKNTRYSIVHIMYVFSDRRRQERNTEVLARLAVIIILKISSKSSLISNFQNGSGSSSCCSQQIPRRRRAPRIHGFQLFAKDKHHHEI
jgi:hypothetical protein